MSEHDGCQTNNQFFIKMTSLNYILARNLRKGKNKKQNGFTLIELMVVVVIVGVLSAVGLPALTKAQDKAKDSATIATLTNAAKECSLSLIAVGDGTDYLNTAGDAPANPKFADVTGDCEVDGTLSLITPGRPVDAANSTHIATVEFIGGVPQTATLPAL